MKKHENYIIYNYWDSIISLGDWHIKLLLKMRTD